MMSVTNPVSGTAFVTFEVPRLDAAVASELKDKLAGLVSDGARRIVLDFEMVEFLDSSGLGALVGARKLMGATGKIEIARPTSKVLKVLKLTRMHQVFTITEDLPIAC